MNVEQILLQFSKHYPMLFEDEDYVKARKKYDDSKVVDFFNEYVNPEYIKQVLDSKRYNDYISEFSKMMQKTIYVSTFERIAMRNYFDQIENYQDFLLALYDLSIEVNETSFNNMVDILERYKYEEKNANSAKWPVISTMCFYLCENCFPTKPTVVKKIAVLLDRDIDYKPRPNYATYQKINKMYGDFKKECSVCQTKQQVSSLLYLVVEM